MGKVAHATEANTIALAAQQINEKATQEIAELQQRIAAAQATLDDQTREVQALREAIAQRHDILADMRYATDQQAKRHSDAVNYASVAQGTTGEQPAYNDVIAHKKLLDTMTTSFDETVRTHTDANTQDEARVETMDASIIALQAEIQQCLTRLRIVEDVRFRSLQELGQSLFADFTAEHVKYTDKIKQARAALVQAQIEDKQFLDEQCTRFAPYPTYQREIKHLLPEDDATLRVLRSELAYIETLLSEGRALAPIMNFPAVSNYYYNWRQILCITANEIYVNETLGGNPRELRARRAHVEQLIAQYCAQRA